MQPIANLTCLVVVVLVLFIVAYALSRDDNNPFQ
jgi:hypothetical protein